MDADPDLVPTRILVADWRSGRNRDMFLNAALLDGRASVHEEFLSIVIDRGTAYCRAS